jgi:hypothetical protein
MLTASHASAHPVPTIPAVQLYFGDPGAGAPLPCLTREHLERLFAVNLSAVRVHVGPQAEQLGFAAFAHGTDLYFAPRFYRPDRLDGLALLAHELTHVFQQQEGVGPRHPGHVRLCADAELERQADEVASAVRLGHSAHRSLTARRGLVAPTPGRARWDVIQPNVHVVIDGEDTKLTNAGEGYTKMVAKVKDPTLQRGLRSLRMRIIEELAEWIKSSRVLWKRFLTSSNERTVRYTSWESLARALLGEVRSRPNREVEKALAEQAEGSDYVNDMLGKYLKFIGDRLADSRKYEKVKKAVFPLLGRYSGEYGHWYPFGGMKKCLHEPEKVSFKNRVAAIHDIANVFKAHLWEYAEIPTTKEWGRALVPQEGGGYTVMEAHLKDGNSLAFRVGGLGKKNATLCEENEIIQAYRELDLPVGFGPSYTTGRTLQVCHSICAHNEMGEEAAKLWSNAIAWGLFAFWNLYYEQRYSRNHTFHEVMDMAKNYGVPYSPYTYPVHAPTTRNPFPVGQMLG